MGRPRKYANASERQRAYVQRVKGDSVGKRIIGGVYLDERTTACGHIGVVHTCKRADHSPAVVFVDIVALRRAPVARVIVRSRNDSFADGCGQCHGSEHADGPLHPCTHAPVGHASKVVGAFVPRFAWQGTDTVETRRYATLDALHVEHVAECKECKRAKNMPNTTWTNTYHGVDVRPLDARLVRALHRSNALHWTTNDERAERERERVALDGRTWAREYHGVIA